MKSSPLSFYKLILLTGFFLAYSLTGCFAHVNGTHRKIVFYISTSGNDHWSGKVSKPNQAKSDGPFATLERARDAIRNLKKKKTLTDSVIVYIRGGNYFLNKTFRLSSLDDGSSDAPIIYRAYQNESVKFIGGLPISSFHVANNDTFALKHFAPQYRKYIHLIDLKKLGIVNYGDFTARDHDLSIKPVPLELFYKDEPMTIARWPNSGWARIDSVPGGKIDSSTFYFHGHIIGDWNSDSDVWLHGYWGLNYVDSYEKLTSIDTAKHEIITGKPYSQYGIHKGARFYVLNVPEELDSPGEWYLNRQTGILYFWPPNNFEQNEVTISTLNTLIALQNVSHCVISDLTFEISRGPLININGGNHLKVTNCILHNAGTLGVNSENSPYLEIQNCQIYQTGSGGIIMSAGDRTTLSPGYAVASNNIIHNYNRWDRTYHPGIKLSGVGDTLSHNHIYDAPHNAIRLSGNNNVIEYNEIDHTCYETNDVGAIYMGRSWIMRGNLIRYNYIHDIHSSVDKTARAIYLDSAFCGTTIEGNLFVNVDFGILIAGGRDNHVFNNIFIKCNTDIYIDAPGIEWAEKDMSEGGSWGLYRELYKFNYNKPPYSTEYPQLAKILNNQPKLPLGNVIQRNICDGGIWLQLNAVKKSWLTIDKNLILKDDTSVVPLTESKLNSLENRARSNFIFKNIPLESIGILSSNH